MSSNFYAILPVDVRYCKNLTPNAKLLYAEITSLLNQNAFCWATNAYFADLFGTSEEAIRKWIKSLADNGFIISEVTKNEKGTSRQISLPTVGKNIPTGRYIFTAAYNENNLNINNKENRIINNSTKEKKEKRKSKDMPNEILHCIKPEIWQEWLTYRKEKKQSLTNTDIKRQLEFLNKQHMLSQDPNEIIVQSIKNGWTGLFPLQKESKKPPAPT
ncbi:MAG: helix-turn-helix domain-containing protein [Campylobacteraceae bacterium]|jgi:biotin operon repressor|nr:helix-turn-helix domain-containing protein [Campylobacteraceae bacterium]